MDKYLLSSSLAQHDKRWNVHRRRIILWVLLQTLLWKKNSQMFAFKNIKVEEEEEENCYLIQLTSQHTLSLSGAEWAA